MELPPVVSDLVAQDADEPGADRRVIAESRLIRKSGQERLLNDVLDGCLVTDA